MKWRGVCLLVVVLILGCSNNIEGTEAAARKYFDAEFKRWVAGETSAVTTMRSRTRMLAPPISYDIRSIVRGEPDIFACKDKNKIPEDWKKWPAFKLNVAIEWKSQAETQMTNVTTYTLTWNTDEQQWYVLEMF